MPRHRFRHASDEEAIQTRSSMRAEHNEIGSPDILHSGSDRLCGRRPFGEKESSRMVAGCGIRISQRLEALLAGPTLADYGKRDQLDAGCFAGLLRCRRCGRMLHVTYSGFHGEVPCRSAKPAGAGPVVRPVP